MLLLLCCICMLCMHMGCGVDLMALIATLLLRLPGAS